MTQFYSEHGEDKWIAEHLPLPERGFYVDLGCAHPIRYSNTAFLRDRGWTGLAVDGNEDYRADWLAAGYDAAFLPAVLSSGHIERFLIHDNSAASRIHPLGREVATFTADELFGGFGVGSIDFLSIDLEGAEYDVIQTLPLSWHQPSIIVSEYATPEIERPRVITHDYRLLDYFTKERGYELVHQTESNHIFYRQ